MRVGSVFWAGVCVLLATWACGETDGGSPQLKTCFEGAEGCPCDDGECRRGLACLSDRCVVRDEASAGANDGGRASDGAGPGSGAGGASEPGGGESDPGSSGGSVPANGGESSGGKPPAGGTSGNTSTGGLSSGGLPSDGGDPGAPTNGGFPPAEAGSGSGGRGTSHFASEPAFFDDFEDGDTAGWSFSAAPWLNVEHDGTRVFTQDLEVLQSAGAALVGESDWTDQWADVRFKFANQGDPLQSYVFVGVRFENSFNTAYVQAFRGGIILLGEVYENAPSSVVQNYTELNYPFDPEKWHTLGIKAEGDTVTAYFDGAAVRSYVIGMRSSGKVALSTNITYASAYFDDVKVFLPE